MKKKILFYGWDNHELVRLKSEVLKFLSKDDEEIFVIYDRNALQEIAKAKYAEGNPIATVIIKRSAFLLNPDIANLIAKFAEDCAKEYKYVSIYLLRNDQDMEVMNRARSKNFAREGDWQQVFAIIRNNI